MAGYMKLTDRAGSDYRDELRRKFTHLGFASLTENEALELLLTLCVRGKNVKITAQTLLHTFGSVRGIFEADPSEFEKMGCPGKSIAIALRIVCAINGLYLREKLELAPVFDRSDAACGCTTAMLELWRSRLFGLKIEVVEVAFLDTEFHLARNGIERLECGTVTATAIHPRKIAESAIHHASKAIIVAHNHPAGSAKPSNCDRHNTNRLGIALKCLEINLLDHVIFSRNEVFSFKKHGLLA
jgi:DNA repair protein RadC